jgi:hypothetical protein
MQAVATRLYAWTSKGTSSIVSILAAGSGPHAPGASTHYSLELIVLVYKHFFNKESSHRQNRAPVTLQKTLEQRPTSSPWWVHSLWEVSWPVGKALWSTTSACASAPGDSSVRPLTPDLAPKFGTPCLIARP